MNFEFFIAKRIISGKSGNRFSKPIIRISILAVSLGMIIMIVSVAILSGFQSKIRDKVIGFGSHIQITNYDSENTLESSPVNIHKPFYPYLDTVDGIRHIQVFANKAGIIKTNDEIQGVIVKGIGSDFDWTFFQQNIIEGKSFHIDDSIKSNKVLISKAIAKKLKLKLNDHVLFYFVQDPPRMRKLEVAGIYETGLAQFDNLYVLADIKHIQKLNDWPADQVSGFEVLIDNYEDLSRLDDFIYEHIGYRLNSTTIIDANQEIFSWLRMQNINVYVIITIIIFIAVINMVSALLILILERTTMIGILKALGARDNSLQKIFVYKATYLSFLGLFWGNVIGIGLCLIQQKFGILTLDQESYYLSVVPIRLNFVHIALLNIGTIFICYFVLFIPSVAIRKISPLKAIRFN